MFGVQAAPGVHAMHWPAGLQTRFTPHELPAVIGTRFWQTGAPLPHEMVPLRHAPPLHGAPGLHKTHWPAGLQK